MATLSRKLISVLVVITGSAVALLFVGSLVAGWLWVSDPDRRDMEPILVFIGLILPPVLAIALRLRARLRGTLTAAATSTEWDSIRGDLIRTVRSHWIDDYLRHSVYQRIRIKLGIAKTPEAIDHPYDIERISIGNSELLTNVSLLRLFDESGGLLVILGEPGSGKTITLVQLADLLLDRAAADPTAPVPVVVPLASWAIDEKPLDEWLRTELVPHYGLSAQTTPALLAEGKRLILLLDGLDEVRAGVRAACLAAIQHFKTTFTADVVVCCREIEYRALPRKVPHGDAIRILPLTSGQIDSYFAAFSGRIDPLILSLRDRAELRELATTPLMLNILTTIYGSEERVAEVPSSASLDTWRDAIFTRYVRLMFQRKEHKAIDGTIVPEDAPFTRGQAVHWLQQIARRMAKQEIATLYLERMTSNWVSSRWKYVVTTVLAYVFVFGLIFGLIDWLISGLIDGLILGGIRKLIFGVVIGLIFGSMFGLIFEFFGIVQLVEPVRFRLNWRELLRGLGRGLVVALITALIFGLAFLLTIGELSYNDDRTVGDLIAGLIISGIFGLLIGLFVGLPLGLLYGLFVGLIEMRSHPAPARPNQAIRTSTKTSFVGGITLAVLTAVTVSVSGGHYYWGTVGFYFGAILFGGGAVMRHYCVRLTLAWEHALRFPLSDRRLVGFLDAMSDRILLTRVGAGWMFIHPLLFEFLAGQPFGVNTEEVRKNLGHNAAEK